MTGSTQQNKRGQTSWVSTHNLSNPAYAKAEHLHEPQRAARLLCSALRVPLPVSFVIFSITTQERREREREGEEERRGEQGKRCNRREHEKKGGNEGREG